MRPVFISPEGLVLSHDKTETTPSTEVESKEPSLDEIAAFEANRVSTKKHQQGIDHV